MTRFREIVFRACLVVILGSAVTVTAIRIYEQERILDHCRSTGWEGHVCEEWRIKLGVALSNR